MNAFRWLCLCLCLLFWGLPIHADQPFQAPARFDFGKGGGAFFLEGAI